MAPKSLICLACFLLVGSAFADEDVFLDIPQGKVKGVKTTTALYGKPLYRFNGIPYVKPMVSENKYTMAEPPEPWSGVYDATQTRSECVFFCMMRGRIVGDDDCLYVNVYSPDLTKDARKAVMVFIHGGGFNAGSSDRSMFGPDYLVENDVIVVTFNHRLGAIGFLGTEDSAAPGNLGLKDQTAALKWVQNNIYNFGGCPHRVTIAGISSGGASVQYHMMSPMSTGLFANAITQSGPAISPWAITYHARENAFKLGKTLGIETTDSAELVNALSKMESKAIAEAALTMDEDENKINGHDRAFLPCVEPDVGQDTFLPADPWELIKGGKMADVPYLAGVTLNESYFYKSVFDNMGYDVLQEHFELTLPSDLNVTNDAARQKEIADSARAFYFQDKPITKESHREIGELLSDVMFGYGTQFSLTMMSAMRSSPIYEYLFTYEGPIGVLKDLQLINPADGGVLHMDDLSYLFYMSAFRPPPSPGSSEEKVVRFMTKLWTNFVKTGNPTSTMDDDITTNWEPMGKEGNYAMLNKDLTMGKKLFDERIKFWASIYKDALGDYAQLF